MQRRRGGGAGLKWKASYCTTDGRNLAQRKYAADAVRWMEEEKSLIQKATLPLTTIIRQLYTFHTLSLSLTLTLTHSQGGCRQTHSQPRSDKQTQRVPLGSQQCLTGPWLTRSTWCFVTLSPVAVFIGHSAVLDTRPFPSAALAELLGMERERERVLCFDLLGGPER